MPRKITLNDKPHSANIDEIDASRSAMRNKLLIILLTTAICSLFFIYHYNEKIYENRFFNIEPGYIWTDQSVSAKFNFPVYKNDEVYQSEVKEARRSALQVFIYEENALEKSQTIIDSTIDNLIETANTNKSKLNKKNKSFQSFEILEGNRYRKIGDVVINYFASAYSRGLINVSLESIVNSEISVRVGNNLTEKIYSKVSLVDTNHFIDRATSLFKESLNEYDAQIALNIAKKAIRPNIVYSQELSNRSKKYAEESITKTIGIVREGDVIVSKGQPINNEVISKLQSYERARMNVGFSSYSFWTIVGSIGHATLIYSILLIYLFIMRKRIFYNNFLMSIISFFIILSAFLSWLSLQIQVNLPFEYLVIIPAISTLAAVVLDSRTAFYITVTMILIFAGIRGNDYDAGTAMLFAGTLGAYTVRDIKGRTQIFKSMFFIFIGFFIPVVVFGMERSADLSQIGFKLLTISINAVISPLVTFGLLFVIERISNITTDLGLQEYDDLNHPLLLRLNEEAPGTYQHTMAVAMLAEKCASAINAHELLTKVGAYFHDIGKLSAPQFFVENQMDSGAMHEIMSPQESADAIRNHVREGILLAKQYNLPARIVDFIPMHHGTTLIKFFYIKAREQAVDKSEVNESDFRYLGPKPATKESAILMICDAAEALSRLAANDKEKLNNQLTELIHDRILDGQFDECNLDFKEINIVKDTCVRSLIAAAHPRVEYKKLEESE